MILSTPSSSILNQLKFPPQHWQVLISGGILCGMRAAGIILFFGGLAAASEPTAIPTPATPVLRPDGSVFCPATERKNLIEREIESAGARHPWAGRYSLESGGRGGHYDLFVSPSGMFTFKNLECYERFDPDDGKARVNDGAVRFEGAQSPELAGKTFQIVSWGERIYLVEREDLPGFANLVNRGHEPRFGTRGLHFLRLGKEIQLVSGRPRLPKGVEPYILDRVLDAVVTSVGPSTTSFSRGHSGDLSTEVTLDVGGRDGILAGMTMTGSEGLEAEATVRHVGERSSEAVMISTVAPQSGWRLSTRDDSRRGWAPPYPPYRSKNSRSTSTVFPPYKNHIGRLGREDSFEGARENGFVVNEVARIELETRGHDYCRLSSRVQWTPVRMA